MKLFRFIKDKKELSIEDAKKLKKEILTSYKNIDFTDYWGGEEWKPHRNFKNFKLTYKDLGISKKDFDDLIGFQEDVWHFCDTILLADVAENDEHILDYCFHGERMNWKEGDEYWLVFNFAFERFEIRKADPTRWIPIEKYIINDNLELRFKFGFIEEKFKDNGDVLDEDERRMFYIKNIGINSFPDRIVLTLTTIGEDDPNFDKYYESYHQILDYFRKYSSLKNSNEMKGFEELIDNRFEICYNCHEILKTLLPDVKRYGLYKENEQEKPEDYYRTFLRYSHQLKFDQAKKKKKK